MDIALVLLSTSVLLGATAGLRFKVFVLVPVSVLIVLVSAALLHMLRAGRERRAASNAEAAALQFETERTYAAAGAVLAAINEEGGVRSHRPAILRGAYNFLKICDQTGVSPIEAAVTVREQSRLIGRPLAKRTVGSTLLLKGLEAETCVILETESLTANHLYVAMTRGARQLLSAITAVFFHRFAN